MTACIAHPRPLETPATPAATIGARGVGRQVDDRPILEQIDLDIPAGAFVALLGANGAGKSTLLSILATLTAPTAGELWLFGQRAGRQSASLRGRIGMIGHQPMLYRDLSAMENLVFFGRLYGLAEPHHRAEALLGRVGLLDRADDPIKAFSRGMVQRASIARALMHDPPLLLADEPFAGLDIQATDRLGALLAELHAEGRTIIMAHHDLAASLGLARRVVVLRRGRVALDAPVAQLSLEVLRSEVTTR